MTWIIVAVVLVLGIALGPALDWLARWSLGHAPGTASLRPRPLVTGVVAGVAAAATSLLTPSWALLPAWVALALVSAAITRTDLACHRIPDVLNAMAFGAGALLLLLPGDTGAYLRGWLAALAVTAVLLILALIGPRGLGMGDVKLGPTLGLYLGFLGWEAVAIGVFAGFLLGALAAVALVGRQLLVRGSLSGALQRALPFGPFLLGGALVGLAW